MQIEFGAPITAARRGPEGVLPLTARVDGIGRNVDGEYALEISVRIEDLDAAVRPVADVDCRCGRSQWRAGFETGRAWSPSRPRIDPIAVVIVFRDA